MVSSCPSVVEDTKGKVYGFVRFNNQNDQREALIHMNGFRGLGSDKRPIKVRSEKFLYQVSHLLVG